MPPVVFQDFELWRKCIPPAMFFLSGHLSAFGTAVPLVFHRAWASLPRGHAPLGVTSGGEVQEGGERLLRNQACWFLAGIPDGTRCGDARTAPGHRGVGGRLQVLPAQRSWQTVLRSEEGGSQSLRPSCAAAAGARRQHICRTSLSTGKGLRWSNDFTLLSPGDALGGGRARECMRARWGSASSGLPCRGFTWGRGTPQSHFPSCHQKRRSCCEVGPFETGPSRFPGPRSLQPLHTQEPSRRSRT